MNNLTPLQIAASLVVAGSAAMLAAFLFTTGVPMTLAGLALSANHDNYGPRALVFGVFLLMGSASIVFGSLYIVVKAEPPKRRLRSTRRLPD